MNYIEWLDTVTGSSLLSRESDRVRLALESIFGDQFLQVGAWGGDSFKKFARTKRAVVAGQAAGDGSDLVMAANNLGVQNDSIDIVLLPHVLEAHDDPHGVLRELDRILRPDGYVVILGFNPVSLWGLRHFLSRRRFPPDCRRLISEYRLRDWLRLLDFSVDHSSFHYFSAPLLRRSGKRVRRTDTPVQAAGEPNTAGDAARRTNRFLRAMRLSISAALQAWRRHAPFAGCYMLVARKALYTATPIRPMWKARPSFIGRLVNPSMRNIA